MVTISIVFKERRRKSKPVWIDRRISDKPASWRETHKISCLKKSLLFGVVLILLVILNCLDLLFTSTALAMGATEINPLMAYFFNQGLTDVAAFIKIGGVGVAAVFLWYFRHLRLTLRVTTFAVLVYTFVLIHHLAGLSLILTSV